MHTTLPSEPTFSRAFEEFATSCLAECVHESLMKEHLGDKLIGHLSREATVIPACDCPIKKKAAATVSTGTPRQSNGVVRAAAKCTRTQRERSQDSTQPDT